MNPNRQSPARPDKQRLKAGPIEPVLRFTPSAWAKLLHFRDLGQTEIGGFGVARSDDPLLVTDFEPVLQEVTAVTIAFDDQAVADFYDSMVDQGLEPMQFGRIWCHSHPGQSATPSMTDEESFARVFGGCDWAVMFIVAKTGKTYARLRHNRPRTDVLLGVEVDFARPFEASDHALWRSQYSQTVRQLTDAGLAASMDVDDWLTGGAGPLDDTPPYGFDPGILHCLEDMEECERRCIMRELDLMEHDHA